MVEHRGRQLSSQLLLLAILTDTFDYLDKYFLKVGQIYFTLWTNIFQWWSADTGQCVRVRIDTQWR